MDGHTVRSQIVYEALYLMQMSLQEELNPVKSDDLDDVLAVADVDLLSDEEQREEQLEAAVPQHDRIRRFDVAV
jgi:hypothetical protein